MVIESLKQSPEETIKPNLELVEVQEEVVDQKLNNIKQSVDHMSNKNLLNFDKAKQQIISSDKDIATLWKTHNPSIESLKDQEAINNIHAMSLVYIHNGINAGETVRHLLNPDTEIRIASIIAIDLLESIKASDSKISSFGNKMTSSKAAKKFGVSEFINNAVSSLKDSGVVDQINNLNSLKNTFAEAEPILKRANTFIDLIRSSRTSFDLNTM
jgi:hypothetical protein